MPNLLKKRPIMTTKTRITIAYGNGIGPEIMEATLKVLHAAKAPLEPEVIEIGETMYKQGHTSGISDEAWESLKRTKLLLKGPITTPQGGGYKSLNVTIRKTLSLYANVRPCVSYTPYIPSKYPNVNLVIIRENEEGLYTGIEYRQTDEVYECLKLISRTGCEKIVRYAFEYAKKFNRKKVTCLSKDNIMKMTDGLFHQVFNEIAADYPNIQNEHLIVDIGTALVATQPERFDVIVTSNLYGDIISDVAAQVVGSVGLAGSANIGDHMAMFEAIHGSAPDIAGKDIANPSGLIHAAIQMLVHIEAPEVASLIENAWLKTIEDGIHTIDIYTEKHSTKKVGTQEFAEALIARLGQKPAHFKPAQYQSASSSKNEYREKAQKTPQEKALVGIDVYFDNCHNETASTIAKRLENIQGPLSLIVIISRGLKVWPKSAVDQPFLRHACLRFQSHHITDQMKTIANEAILDLLNQINDLGFDVIKTENLYTFDNQIGFSLAQGQ